MNTFLVLFVTFIILIIISIVIFVVISKKKTNIPDKGGFIINDKTLFDTTGFPVPFLYTRIGTSDIYIATKFDSSGIDYNSHLPKYEIARMLENTPDKYDVTTIDNIVLDKLVTLFDKSVEKQKALNLFKDSKSTVKTLMDAKIKYVKGMSTKDILQLQIDYLKKQLA